MSSVAKSSTPSTMRAVRVNKLGGPDVLTLDSAFAVPSPGPGDVQVRVAAAGVNYIDTYMRTGLYKTSLPFTMGREGAGVVTAVGSAVTDVKVGARVAFMAENAYADYVVIPAAKAVPVPDQLPLQTAAAALLQGMTAHFLTHSTYAVKRNDNVLIHAGAGGSGQLLIQICKRRGARVITTVGSKDKEAIVRALGADEVVNYTTHTDFPSEVKRLTSGAGVHVVYDGVGLATWQRSLQSLQTLGHLVLFGNASGKVPPIDPLDLSSAGSITLTRPTLFHYIATPAALQQRAQDVFTWLLGGMRLTVARTFPLSEAADAHRYLESRASAGKILLVCDASLN